MIVEFLFKNIGLKLVALLLAVFTWLATHAMTSREEILTDIPLEVKIPEGFAVRDTSVGAFEVTFRGSKEDVLKLDSENILVEIDLESVTAGGEQVVWLSDRNVIFSGSARVAEIKPPEVRITLGQQISKTVEVKPNIIGTLDPGFKVEMASCDPAEVTLIGSRERLNEVELVQTEPFDITGLIQSRSQRLSLLPPGEDWSGRIEPNKVMVTVQLTEQVSHRVMEKQVVHVLLKNERKPLIQLKPATVAVTVQGNEEALNALEPGSLFVYVNCAGVEEARNYELPVRVDTPEGVEAVDIDPPLIKVEVGQ